MLKKYFNERQQSPRFFFFFCSIDTYLCGISGPRTREIQQSSIPLQGKKGEMRREKKKNTHVDSAYDQSYHFNKFHGRRKKNEIYKIKILHQGLVAFPDEFNSCSK